MNIMMNIHHVQYSRYGSMNQSWNRSSYDKKNKLNTSKPGSGKQKNNLDCLRIAEKPILIIGILVINDEAAIEEKKRFYEILTDELNKISRRKEIVISGNFIGRTDKRENGNL